VRTNTPSPAGRRIAHLLFLIGFAVGAYLALSAFDRAAWADDGRPAESVTKPVADAGKVPAVPRLTPPTSTMSPPTGRRTAVPRAEHRKTVVPKPAKRAAADPEPRSWSEPVAKPESSSKPVSQSKLWSKPVSQSKSWIKPAAKPQGWSDPVRPAKERTDPVPAAKAAAGGLPAEVRKTSVPRVAAADAAKRQVVTAGTAARHLIGQATPVAAPTLPESPIGLILDAERELIAALLPAGWTMPALPVPALPVPALPLPATVGALPATSFVTVAPAPPSAAASPPVAASAGQPLVTAAATTPADPASSTPRMRAHVAAHDGGGFNPAPARPSSPVSPPRPGGQSAGAGQSRDSGGGAPPTAVVPSAWWPAVVATTVRPPTNASATGRSVRYSGPPR
jgi:hypothetical protein